MAKRRKEKDEEDDAPFKLPKFDKESFLKKEKKNIKITVLAFLFGVGLAVIAFGFWALLSGNSFRWPLVLLFGIFSGSWFRYLLLRLNVDTSSFTRKNWFTYYAVYFFTWLIVLIVLVNPPFYDDECPRVELAILPGIQEPGGDILIVTKVTDNVGVETNDITLEITDPNDEKSNINQNTNDWNMNNIIQFTYTNPDNLIGDFDYKLTVKDVNGHTKIRTGTFSYDTNAIEITSPPLDFFENITSGVDIKIEVDEEVSPYSFRVYYTLNDGDEINVNRRDINKKDKYETSPEYEGWTPNNNFTMKVFAQTSRYFTNINQEYNNTIMDTTIYNFTTANDFGIGDEIPPVPWDWTKKPELQKREYILNFDYANTKDSGDESKVIDADEFNNKNLLPHYHSVQTPGFEIIIFLAAILAVVLIFKYKKKDEKN